MLPPVSFGAELLSRKIIGLTQGRGVYMLCDHGRQPRSNNTEIERRRRRQQCCQKSSGDLCGRIFGRGSRRRFSHYLRRRNCRTPRENTFRYGDAHGRCESAGKVTHFCSWKSRQRYSGSSEKAQSEWSVGLCPPDCLRSPKSWEAIGLSRITSLPKKQQKRLPRPAVINSQRLLNTRLPLALGSRPHISKGNQICGR